MNTKFKLKKQARQFFDKELHSAIMSLDSWKKNEISIHLLDEVESIYVEYGIKSGENSKNMKGWSSNNGNPTAHINFTLHINDINLDEYDDIDISEVMDKIQSVLNTYFKNKLS